MATQAEAISYIKSNFKHEDLGDGVMKFLFDLVDGRSQVVLVEVAEEFVIYSSPFGTINDLTPKQALAASAEVILGIQLFGDAYCVRHVAPLEDLDPSEVVEGFSMVAVVADTLEKDLVGGDKF